jgi:WD40 repeat protein
MQRLYFFLPLIVSAGLVVGCIPATIDAPKVDVEKTSTPTQASQSSPMANDRYSNCLSPALKMTVEHAAHTATLLPNGNVLIAGGFLEKGTSEIASASAEIFDPATNTFTPTGNMNEPRNGHTATLLPNGLVLIVGGWNLNGRSATAELYEPETGIFHYTGSLMAPRQGMAATLLENGQVLISGGDSARNTPQLVTEIFDPSTQKFSPSGELNAGRMGHSATLLNDSSVLLVGGASGEKVLASAEIYDPNTGEFTLANDANEVRYKHGAVLMQDGTVLVIGGSNQNDWTGKYKSAEVYNPEPGIFTKVSDMNAERFKLTYSALLLPDGNVLVSGGNRMIEIFDPQTQSFIQGGILDNDYYSSVSTLLENGSVLITGGYDNDIQPSDKAWLYC